MIKEPKPTLATLAYGTLLASSDGASTGSSEPVKEGKRVYFAAPLFSQAERDYNLKVVALLERYGYQVFLPQRDGYLAPELTGLSKGEKVTKIFNKDYEEVIRADIFFGLFDGRAPDEGVCVELGVAYSKGKRCYGLKTDARSIELDMDLNPMILGCLNKLFYNLNGDAAIAELTDYLENNRL